MMGDWSSSGSKVRNPLRRIPSTSAAWFSRYRAWRASMPPSSSSSFTAWKKARTTCVGEVKRHLPRPFSISAHWSYKSKDRERETPSHRDREERLAMTKPKPGTPWMHLFALLTRKSIPSLRMSMGMPPKLLMASTMNVRPRPRIALATASTGFRMPVVVSQCTMARWEMSGCSSSARRTASGVTGTVSFRETRT